MSSPQQGIPKSYKKELITSGCFAAFFCGCLIDGLVSDVFHIAKGGPVAKAADANRYWFCFYFYLKMSALMIGSVAYYLWKSKRREEPNQ